MPAAMTPFAAIRDTAISQGGFVHDLDRHCISYVLGNDVLIVSFDNLHSVSVTEDRKPWGF